MKHTLAGTTKIICVEENATAQLAALARQNGISVDEKILRYGDSPFTYANLLWRVRGMVS